MRVSFSGALRLPLLVVCIPVLASPPTQWTSHGPGGGGALFFPSLSPHNVDELYIGCDMSPEFHSRDFGKTWETINFRQLQSTHVCFTKDPKILWAITNVSSGGSDAARPCRSTDGGQTWQLPAEPVWPASRKAYVLCADPENPNWAIASAEYRELWVTLDGSKSWEKKFATASDAGLVLGGAFWDGDTIYAGTNAGLLVSRDGGKTFVDSHIGGMAAGEHILSMAGAKSKGTTRLIAVASSNLWAGMTGAEHGGYRGVYVLDVGQQRWVKATEGIDPPAQPFFVAMTPGDIDTAYVGGGYGYPKTGPSVFRTSNGGETWTSVFNTEHNRNIEAGWMGDGGVFHWSWPEYALGMDISPIDKNRVVITDLGCVHATTDGGKKWTALYTKPAQLHAAGSPIPKDDRYMGNGLEPTSLWWLSWLSKNTMIACYTDIMGCRSDDGGKSWSWNYTGHRLNTMYHVIRHPTTGVAYLANSSVHDMYRSTHLADQSIDKGQGSVMFSTDEGVHWEPLKNFGHPVIWLAADPKNPERLYASVIHSKNGGIYRTDELGKGAAAAWTRLPAPPRTEGHPMNAYALDDGNLVCSYSGRRTKQGFTSSAGVFLSTDRGKTWEDRSDPAMRYWTQDLIIDPSDKAQNTWYACTFMAWGKTAPEARQSGLYRTTDRGKTWKCIADKQLAPSGVLNVSSCTVNPANRNELYFATEYDGLYYTDNLQDEKPRFQQVKSYPFRNPARIFINPYDSREVWVSSFGNGMYVGRAE